MSLFQVGEMLYGFCNGYFGRDSYEDKRVEAVGYDWVVVRDDNGRPQFASFEKEEMEYIAKASQEWRKEDWEWR